MPLFSDVPFQATLCGSGLYIKMYREYQAHLDSILEELHQAVGKLEGTPDYDRISFIQTLHGVGFLSAVVLIAEMGSFDLFSSPKKLYAYFGLDPGVNDSGKFHGDRVHMSKRGSSLARRILHMVAINNLKVDKATKTPVNPVIYDYYTRKCASKKKERCCRGRHAQNLQHHFRYAPG